MGGISLNPEINSPRCALGYWGTDKIPDHIRFLFGERKAKLACERIDKLIETKALEGIETFCGIDLSEAKGHLAKGGEYCRKGMYEDAKEAIGLARIETEKAMKKVAR